MAGRSPALDQLEPHSAIVGSSSSDCPDVSDSSTRHDWATALLQACAGRRRARTDRGWLGQALSIFWPAISRGSSTVARSDSMPADVVAGETSVEMVLPEGRGCFQLCCSGWSWVVGVDAVGGLPHCDFG